MSCIVIGSWRLISIRVILATQKNKMIGIGGQTQKSEIQHLNFEKVGEVKVLMTERKFI